MQILSYSDSMIAYLPDTNVWDQWYKGTHTVRVWQGENEIDCYTFGWEKNYTYMLDFTTALQSYLSEV